MPRVRGVLGVAADLHLQPGRGAARHMLVQRLLKLAKDLPVHDIPAVDRRRLHGVRGREHVQQGVRVRRVRGARARVQGALPRGQRQAAFPAAPGLAVRGRVRRGRRARQRVQAAAARRRPPRRRDHRVLRAHVRAEPRHGRGRGAVLRAVLRSAPTVPDHQRGDVGAQVGRDRRQRVPVHTEVRRRRT